MRSWKPLIYTYCDVWPPFLPFQCCDLENTESQPGLSILWALSSETISVPTRDRFVSFCLCSAVDSTQHPFPTGQKRIPHGPGNWVPACGPRGRLSILVDDLVSCSGFFSERPSEPNFESFSQGRQVPGTLGERNMPHPPPFSSAFLTGQFGNSEVLPEPRKPSSLQHQGACWPQSRL